MKFQVTCTIDDKLLAPLVELMAPYGRVVVRLIEGQVVSSPPPGAIPTVLDKRQRRVPAFSPNRGMGRIIALRLVAKEATIPQLKAAYRQAGISPNGTGANLSKLRKNGYVRRVSEGVWRITPKGESAVRRLDAGGPMEAPKAEEAHEQA